MSNALQEAKQWANTVLIMHKNKGYDTSSFSKRIINATTENDVHKIIRDLKKEYGKKQLEDIVTNSSKTQLHTNAQIALKKIKNMKNTNTIKTIKSILNEYSTREDEIIKTLANNHAKTSQNTLLFTGAFIVIGIISTILLFTLKPGSGFQNMNETEINPVIVMTVILLIILFVLIWSK